MTLYSIQNFKHIHYLNWNTSFSAQSFTLYFTAEFTTLITDKFQLLERFLTLYSTAGLKTYSLIMMRFKFSSNKPHFVFYRRLEKTHSLLILNFKFISIMSHFHFVFHTKLWTPPMKYRDRYSETLFLLQHISFSDSRKDFKAHSIHTDILTLCHYVRRSILDSIQHSLVILKFQLSSVSYFAHHSRL